MTIDIKTPGIHDLALRCTDLERSRRFYAELLGFTVVLEAPNIFIFLAGASAVAIRRPEAGTPQGDVFNPFRVGLDHVALACTDGLNSRGSLWRSRKRVLRIQA